MARRKRSYSRSNPHTFAIVVSLIVFLGIFLTLYVLMGGNTDLRSRAGMNGEQGIGNAVSEQVSPLVKISSPTNNESVTSPVIVTADVTSNQDVVSVQFFVDGGTDPVNEVFEAPYEASVTLSSGRHRVYVLVQDSAENIKRSQEVSFQVR